MGNEMVGNEAAGAGLRLSGLGRRIGGRWIVDGVDLSVAPGQTLCVVGPSGCGKTSLLRLVAGLDAAETGSVVVDGRDVTRLPPQQRPLAMVFQGESLFPELSVAQNIAFGMAARGIAKQQQREAVEVAMLRVGLTGLGDRLPHQISGGQQRRVAVARAMVLRPSVLLLDEPMGGLDEVNRTQLSRQLHQLARRGMTQDGSAQGPSGRGGGTTVVHVTHDQAEALSGGDLLAVMDQGRVMQLGTPVEVFTRPSSQRVAAFLGRSNFLQADLVEVRGAPGSASARIHVLGQDLEVACHDGLLGKPQGEATLMVRPHAVRLAPPEAADFPLVRPREVHGEVGIVQRVAYLGDRLDLVVETDRGTVVVAGALDEPYRAGDGVRVQVLADRTWLLPVGQR